MSAVIERGGSGLWSDDEVEADIEDVKNILRCLGVLDDGTEPVRHRPTVFPGGYYEDAPFSGCWYPLKDPGDTVAEGEVLGRICDVFGEELFAYRAKEDGIVLFRTASLGIEKGRPMIAYGVFGERA